MGCGSSRETAYKDGSGPYSDGVSDARRTRTPSTRLRDAKAAVPPDEDCDKVRNLSNYAAEGNLDKVLEAIRDGANVNGRVKSSTALMTAARYGFAALIGPLIEAGADCDARDKVSRTPLITAARYGNADVVKELVRGGAALDSTDAYGRTAAMTASMCGQEPTVILAILMEAGADMRLEDLNGKNAMTLAREGSHWDIVQTLSTSKLSPFCVPVSPASSEHEASSRLLAGESKPPIAAVMSVGSMAGKPSPPGFSRSISNESKVEPLEMSAIFSGSLKKVGEHPVDPTPSFVSRASSVGLESDSDFRVAKRSPGKAVG